MTLKMSQNPIFSFNGRGAEIDDFQNLQNTLVRKTPLKPRKIKPDKPMRKHKNSGPKAECSVKSPSPNANDGKGENLEEPETWIKNDPSHTDLGAENEDPQPNGDKENGSDLNEDWKTLETYYESCRALSVVDNNHLVEIPECQTITPHHESSSNNRTWLKIELHPEMAQNLARILGEKLESDEESSPSMKMHLITAKNVLEDALTKNAVKHEGLAISRDAGSDDHDLERDDEFVMREGVRLLQEIVDTTQMLKDLVLKCEGILNQIPQREEDWDEDLENESSFPTFLVNFLLIAGICAVFVFPPVFMNHDPGKLWESILAFNMSMLRMLH